MPVRSRQEQIRDEVLQSISDDYESLEYIVKHLNQQPELEALGIDAKEITQALRSLIQDGLAASYLLSATPPHAAEVPFSYDVVDELWFYVTVLGKEAATSSQGSSGNS
jgi:hypothetical protein